MAGPANPVRDGAARHFADGAFRVRSLYQTITASVSVRKEVARFQLSAVHSKNFDRNAGNPFGFRLCQSCLDGRRFFNTEIAEATEISAISGSSARSALKSRYFFRDRQSAARTPRQSPPDWRRQYLETMLRSAACVSADSGAAEKRAVGSEPRLRPVKTCVLQTAAERPPAMVRSSCRRPGQAAVEHPNNSRYAAIPAGADARRSGTKPRQRSLPRSPQIRRRSLVSQTGGRTIPTVRRTAHRTHPRREPVRRASGGTNIVIARDASSLPAMPRSNAVSP